MTAIKGDKAAGQGQLTLRTRRLRTASAAKIRSPAAESSIFHDHTSPIPLFSVSRRGLGYSPKRMATAAGRTNQQATSMGTYSSTASEAARAGQTYGSRGQGQPHWSPWQRRRLLSEMENVVSHNASKSAVLYVVWSGQVL